MTPQGPNGPLRVLGPVVPGGTVTVEVACPGDHIEISTGAPGATQSVPVGADRTARFVVPPVPGGTVLCIGCGHGRCAYFVLVEVFEP